MQSFLCSITDSISSQSIGRIEKENRLKKQSTSSWSDYKVKGFLFYNSISDRVIFNFRRDRKQVPDKNAHISNSHSQQQSMGWSVGRSACYSPTSGNVPL